MNLAPAKQFKKTRVLPKQTLNMSNQYEVLYSIYEGRFYRLSNVNPSMRIRSIDIVQNPALEARFLAKQKQFQGQGIGKDGTEPILVVHGTASNNIDKILQENFSLDKFKCGVHGFGIYFSEQPEVSRGYVRDCSSMIMCKLLKGDPGKNCKVK